MGSGLFGWGPHDEDSDERTLGRHAKKQNLCLKKFWVKNALGQRVQRTCIKKKGHWWPTHGG